MVMVNMSTRLDDELHKVVLELKSKNQLGSVLRLLVSAIKQDKASVITFLLGLSDSSVSHNKLQDNMVTANLYEKYLGLGLDMSFNEWVSELSQADIHVNAGLQLPSYDVKEILYTVIDDLGLQLVEKSSAETLVSNLATEANLEALLSKLIDDKLGKVSTSEGNTQTESSQTVELDSTRELEEVLASSKTVLVDTSESLSGQLVEDTAMGIDSLKESDSEGVSDVASEPDIPDDFLAGLGY